MVLEPWITPSLFYRFLDKKQGQVGIDSWTVCETLGPTEGNKLYRAHWDSWINEDTIEALAKRGVEIVRLPIGDWTLNQYGPYVGCMDGAAEAIDHMFDICAKYGIEVLLDVHAMKGSQNGFDNSGRATKLTWINDTYFSHWPGESADWQGQWNFTTWSYDFINHTNINLSLKNAEDHLKRWGHHKAFAAYEPVNEPWWSSDMDELKDFYRKSRKLVQQYSPNATFVFHNAFNYDAGFWNDLFADDDHDKVAMDHHYY